MKKIPTIFVRNPEDMSRVLDEINPECQWVFDGEGVATEKFDGQACLVRDGRLWKRREVKRGKPLPDGFVSVGETETKAQGWLPVDPDDPSDKWFVRAWDECGERTSEGHTYELVGPKVQGNPYGLKGHVLWEHGWVSIANTLARTFDNIRLMLERLPDIEGLVYHHPDGRMGKIKRKDYGLMWPPEKEER